MGFASRPGSRFRGSGSPLPRGRETSGGVMQSLLSPVWDRDPSRGTFRDSLLQLSGLIGFLWSLLPEKILYGSPPSQRPAMTQAMKHFSL